MSTTTATEPVYPIDEAMLIPIHPAAAAFPTLGRRDLRELVEDIRVQGLQQPIVLIREGETVYVLDGANRRAACEKAGVEPRFEWYEGSNPEGYVMSANLRRRHMTPGQRAACAAKVLTTRANSASQSAIALDVNVSQSAVSHAFIVNEDDPDLLQQVIDGKVTLGAAYDTVRRRKEGRPISDPIPIAPSDERATSSPLAIAVRAALTVIGTDDPVTAGMRATDEEVPTTDLLKVRDFFVATISARS
jgi:hypothetical protein